MVGVCLVCAGRFYRIKQHPSDAAVGQWDGHNDVRARATNSIDSIWPYMALRAILVVQFINMTTVPGTW